MLLQAGLREHPHESNKVNNYILHYKSGFISVRVFDILNIFTVACFNVALLNV